LVICSVAFAFQSIGQTKTLAERLGYNATDKLLIVTAEDAGLCNAVNESAVQILQKGLVKNTTIMLPCPWSMEMVEFSKRNASYSYGLQLTLTSDFKNTYCWRPVSPAEKVPTLVNDRGFMYPEMNDVYRNADLSQVETELQSQISLAKKVGLEVHFLTSHLDILTYDENYFRILVKLASANNLPIRFLNQPSYGNDLDSRVKLLDEKHIVHPDYIVWNELDSIKSTRDVKPVLDGILRNLKPGVTELFISTAILSPEIKRLTRNYSRRVEQHEWAESPELAELVKELGIKIISYNELYKLQQAEK